MPDQRSVPWPIVLTPMAWAVGGLVVGLVTKWADESGIDWLGDLGTGLGVWIVATVLIGRVARGWRSAAVAAVGFFAAMLIGYYAYTVVILGYPVDRPTVAGWLVLALLACPLLAAIVAWARQRPGIAAVVHGLAAAGVMSVGYFAIGWQEIVGGMEDIGADHRLDALLTTVMALAIVGLVGRFRWALVAAIVAAVTYLPIDLVLTEVMWRLPML
ncbi:DUF6518 family protein [Janibacter sp. GXQ6167]|uniref:DUF6518 family protein n=1 Tax=Janibacter sp. GXQ6167 TaxID=3240791 RepID=UPI0035252F64